MARAAAQLHQVETLREARLEALQQGSHLRRAHHAPAVPQPPLEAAVPLPCCCPAAAQLYEARLQAADDRYSLQLAQLELLKQLEALQELQWQLDCVVAQLGLQPAPRGGDLGAVPATAVGGGDLMLLLGKVEELRLAQLQLAECQRRLEFAEGELASSQQQQRQQGSQQPVAGDAAQARLPQGSELGASSRELVGALLQENEQLRKQAADAEERYQGLERDYEVELLLKAEAEEAAGSPCAGQEPPPLLRGQAKLVIQACGEQRDGVACRPGRPAAGGSQGRDPSCKRALQQAPSQPTDHAARRQLEVRLQSKDAQLSQLRKVVQQLEGKLIDAHKRQADLVMQERGWQEQEARNCRIAQLEEEQARLTFAAQEAQAVAEAARKEAAAQRRLADRLQQRVDAAEGEGAGGSAHVVELLQKRVKVLEAQCQRLRLQARSGREAEEEAAAAAAAAAAASAARQRQGGGSGARPAAACQGADGDRHAGSAVGENDPPNMLGEGAAGGMARSNPVLEQWQAGKRLQKRVDALQAKLREKTTALVTAQAAQSRAEEQVAHLQAGAEQHQAALKQLSAQLRQADERTAPGAMVAISQWRELLLELQQLQVRHDALERQHALLQRWPGSGSGGGRKLDSLQRDEAPAAPAGSTTPGLPASSCGEDALSPVCDGQGVGRVEVHRYSKGRAYCPAEYSGGLSTASQPATDPAAKLLQKDVQLFDAALQRDQAAAEAERHRRRLHRLLDSLSTHPDDDNAAAAIAEARQLAGLPALPCREGVRLPAGAKRAAAAGGGKPAGGRRPADSDREQELLATVALLKGVLERTRKALESGVSSAKYMQAVDKAKQLKAQCRQLEERLDDAARLRQELAKAQQQLGALHSTHAALKSQLKAAREQAAEALAREHTLGAQAGGLGTPCITAGPQPGCSSVRWLRASAPHALTDVGEEVRVLAAEGLHPADLVQELLVLRPRVRELEQQNAALAAELAAFDAHAFGQQLEQLAAEHEQLLQRCRWWEAAARAVCERHGEAPPLGPA